MQITDLKMREILNSKETQGEWNPRAWEWNVHYIKITYLTSRYWYYNHQSHVICSCTPDKKMWPQVCYVEQTDRFSCFGEVICKGNIENICVEVRLESEYRKFSKCCLYNMRYNTYILKDSCTIHVESIVYAK